ncbi:MAG TPA: hypothetical protein VFE47_16385 [Tepidisphaeraceae bacterium]|nr:hypothetical protein [Tepidisphaeraceae bacterium]
MSKTRASFLDWGRVSIVPNPTAEQTKEIPPVVGVTHYGYARDTDSALAQVTDADGKQHTEKFLFYRGLGNFSLPVTLTAQGHDRFELHNTSSSPIPTAFLIQIDGKDPSSARLAKFEHVTANLPMTLPPGKVSQNHLATMLRESLVASGLYEKEASAMVKTWKDTWLAEPGTRLLYIVPRPVVDSMLPLQITPTPADTARVLVGRIDILTPENESRLQAMVAAASLTTDLPADDARFLTELGRFYDPAIERAEKLLGDAKSKQSELLWTQWRRAAAGKK